MPTNLIVDLNNLAFMTRHSVMVPPKSRAKKDPFASAYILLHMLQAVVSHSTRNKASGIVIACDSKNVWRHDIYPGYKQSDDTFEDIYYDDTIHAADLFKTFFREHSPAFVLETPRAEADDIIAVWCQESVGVNNVILSSDKDFIQLINERTTLYSIPQKTFRTVPEGSTSDFELFLKCIRGDMGNDKITSAYPRVRKQILEEAWADDYKLLNLMETVLKSGEKVGDLFERNLKLIDLTQQPQKIRSDILGSINNYKPNVFSEFNAMRVLYEMGIKNQTNLFGGYSKPFKNSPVFIAD